MIELAYHSYGDLGIFLGGGQTERIVHQLRNNRHTGDALSNQPKAAGVLPQRNVGLEVNLSHSLSLVENSIANPSFSSRMLAQPE